jgi:hypothetical protein
MNFTDLLYEAPYGVSIENSGIADRREVFSTLLQLAGSSQKCRELICGGIYEGTGNSCFDPFNDNAHLGLQAECG